MLIACGFLTSPGQVCSYPAVEFVDVWVTDSESRRVPSCGRHVENSDVSPLDQVI